MSHLVDFPAMFIMLDDTAEIGAKKTSNTMWYTSRVLFSYVSLVGGYISISISFITLVSPWFILTIQELVPGKIGSFRGAGKKNPWFGLTISFDGKSCFDAKQLSSARN